MKSCKLLNCMWKGAVIYMCVRCVIAEKSRNLLAFGGVRVEVV